VLLVKLAVMQQVLAVGLLPPPPRDSVVLVVSQPQRLVSEAADRTTSCLDPMAPFAPKQCVEQAREPVGALALLAREPMHRAWRQLAQHREFVTLVDLRPSESMLAAWPQPMAWVE
jgi:hypothetical protein